MKITTLRFQFLILLLCILTLVFALSWNLIIDYVDKITKEIGFKTPSYFFTILEKESGFGKDIGDNLGNKKENIQRCINYCDELFKQGIKGVYCDDKKIRREWCENKYKALERITSRLGLDVNKVPFSPDFGMGYTQFQPTTWENYPQLKNKNPWSLEDALYAAALKLFRDGIHENEILAISRYNNSPNYVKDFYEKRQEWD